MQAVTPSTSKRALRILLVSDHVDERQRLRGLMAEIQINSQPVILEAETDEMALQVFDQQHPDLLLLSAGSLIGLRRLSQSLCNAIRSREGDRHTGIICLAPYAEAKANNKSAAVADDSLSVECLEMGADDYLRHQCSLQEVQARVRAVLRLKAMTDELRRANHRLHVLSMTDDLTGLANMRSFNQRYSDIMRDCRKGKQAIGVIMLDLDHFKSVNDTTNHLIGSFVLSEIGRLFRQANLFAAADVAARYGGDEFIAVCLAESSAALAAQAERIRAAIATHVFMREGCSLHITTSVGTAWVPAGYQGKAEDIIKAADLMLYRSKNDGRNRVHNLMLSGASEADTSLSDRLSQELSAHEEQELEIRAKARKPFAA